MQLWRVNDGDVSPFDFGTFESEKELQDLIERNPEILPIDADLMILAREVPLGSGVADFLAVDMQTGQLVIIETKLGTNSDSRRVVAQILDYAADVFDQDIDYVAARTDPGVWDALGPAGQEVLAGSAKTGEIWLLVVMDEVPDRLVKVAHYFQSAGARFRLDLVSVRPGSVGVEDIVVTDPGFRGIGDLARTYEPQVEEKGTPGRPFAHPRETIELAKRLKDQGYSLSRIQRITGIPRSSAHRYLLD